MKAVVVFRDDCNGHPLNRFLRIKHVFCVVDDGRGWIRVDSTDGYPMTNYVAPNTDDLATFYRGAGYKVLEGKVGDKPAPPMVWANCVGLVKAFIGVRTWAITPYGLYRHLRRNGWC